MKKLFSLGSLLLLIAIASPNSAKASNLAADNSSLYSGGWTDGSNQGIGFGAWNLTNTSGAGRYIGGTGENAVSSFGLFSSDTGSSSDALRPFTGGPLLAGQTFSISIGYNGINAGGLVGLDLRDSGGNAAFSLQGDGSGNWLIFDGGTFFDSGVAESANTPFVFTFTYNGGQNYTFTLGLGGNTFNGTSNLGDISSVHLYSFQQGPGQNFGFDNLAVVPEPSTWVMMAGGLGMLTLLRRRSRS